MFRIGKGSLARKLKIFRVQFFISGFSPLPAGLDNTPMESGKNKIISPLSARLDSTLVDFPASPLYVGSLSLLSPLLFFFKENSASKLIILGQKRDPELLRVGQVVPSKKHIMISNLGFVIQIFPFSISTSRISLKIPNQKTEYRNEVPRLDISSWLDKKSPNKHITISIRTSLAKRHNQIQEIQTQEQPNVEVSQESLNFSHIHTQKPQSNKAQHLFVYDGNQKENSTRKKMKQKERKTQNQETKSKDKRKK